MADSDVDVIATEELDCPQYSDEQAHQVDVFSFWCEGIILCVIAVFGLIGNTLSAAILTGRRFTAPEALAAGIVTATAPEADVLPMALDLAAANAAKDRAIIRTHKDHLHGS